MVFLFSIFRATASFMIKNSCVAERETNSTFRKSKSIDFAFSFEIVFSRARTASREPTIGATSLAISSIFLDEFFIALIFYTQHTPRRYLFQVGGDIHRLIKFRDAVGYNRALPVKIRKLDQTLLF